MLVKGSWYECDDGVVRPVVGAEVAKADGSWVSAPLLLDTGADRTVLSALVLAELGLPTSIGEPLDGVGGLCDCVLVGTDLRLTAESGDEANFRSDYAAVTDVDGLDMSVLGRDILELFTVIVDRTGDAVFLLHGRHTYRVEWR